MVIRVDDSGKALTGGAQIEVGGNDRYNQPLPAVISARPRRTGMAN